MAIGLSPESLSKLPVARLVIVRPSAALRGWTFRRVTTFSEMPRYYFHTEDGGCYPDEHGSELPDLAAVRHMALVVMGQMSQAIGDDVWRHGQMRATVKDEDGLSLLTLDVIATTSAAMAQVPA